MFFPWEKLPALILGPLMACLGAWFLFGATTTGDSSSVTAWGIVLLIGGIAITIFGIVEQINKKD